MKYLSAGSDLATQSQNGLKGNTQIDWNDYNYPSCRCIQMFHYIYQQTPERYRKRTLLLKFNHWAIILVLALNILTNIIGTAQGVQSGGLRIGLSFFMFLIFIPISFYLFILPYQIMCGGQGTAIIFYILSIVTTIWFFIWSIADFADANGFVEVKKNFDNSRAATGVFGLIVAIISLLIGLVTLLNTVLFYKRD